MPLPSRKETEDLVKHIDEFGEDLTEWEIDFIADLIDNPPAAYSEKQETVIQRIYEQRC